MYLTRKHLSRRTLLKAAGVSLGLPLLDAMIPAATALAQTAAARKLRVGYFYIPEGAVMYNTKYGAQMDRWTASGEGADFTLNTIMKSLEPYKKYVTSFGNIKNDLVGGIHTRNPGTWLGNPAEGATVDQVIAAQIGKSTPFESLQLASETTNQQAAGGGVATGSTVSFRDASTPLKMEFKPREIFLRLFGDAKGGLIAKQTAAEEASLLDLITDQTVALQRDLGPADRAILDSHLTAVREAEQRSSKRAQGKEFGNITLPPMPAGDMDFDERVQFVFDVISIAYRADLTRVVTFMMAGESTSQSYKHIGVPEGFGPLAHHSDDLARIEKIVRIQTWHMEMFAQFLGKLAATPDGDGTLLDNAMLLYGSNMSNSSLHSTYPLPTLLVGGAAANLTGGRQMDLSEPTPICNLHLTMLGLSGVDRKRFGDSTGTISL